MPLNSLDGLENVGTEKLSNKVGSFTACCLNMIFRLTKDLEFEFINLLGIY